MRCLPNDKTDEKEEENIMAYTIRKVKYGDESALAYIQTESWKSAFKDILSEDVLKKTTDIDRVTAMYKRLLDEKMGNGYILEIDGKPHCFAYWDQTSEKDMPGVAEIICIHSVQNNWRKGYGSRMMDRLLEDITAAGYANVMLWVFVENERARKFYEAKGFVSTGKTQPAFDSMEICYTKKLIP
jgi:ribosomal protein S18 acetylase RimI-like enzyme